MPMERMASIKNLPHMKTALLADYEKARMHMLGNQAFVLSSPVFRDISKN